MKIYYAHPMLYYNTDLERADIAQLETLGTVINPNTPAFRQEVKALKAKGLNPMSAFLKAIQTADAVAWRPFMNGKIGAGIAMEMIEGLVRGKRLIKMPDMADVPFSSTDILTILETKNRR